MAEVLPAPLTHGGSGDTPVSLRSAGIKSQEEGWGCPARGEGEAGGPEGPEAGTSAILAGKEQHCTASRPSRPPGARGPAPRRPKADRHEDRGRAGEPGSPQMPERLGLRKRVKGATKGRGEGRRVDRGIPEGRFPTPERCARLLFKYSHRAARGSVAMVTRVPATD